MTFRQCSGFSFLLGLFSLAWAPDPASAQTVGTGVLDALRVDAEVRILVALKAPAPPTAPPEARHLAIRSTQERVLEATSAADVEVLRRYDALSALVATVTGDGLEALLANPEVERVDLDAPGSGMLAESVPLINADVLHEVDGLTGSDVTVAILDSGMDRNHPDLSGALVAEQCFCSGGGGCCPNGAASQSGPGSAADDHSHGTHVTSIVAGAGSEAPVGVAPGTSVVAIKVLDSNNEFCCSSDVIAGLDWILTERPDVDVVNLSLGTFAVFAGDCDTATAFTMAYAEAVDGLVERGVSVFAAAGNTFSPALMSAPGCVANAISVGATDKVDQVGFFSGGGPTLDLLAPGIGIRAGRLSGGSQILTGTSQASPHAAGVAALLLEASPRLTPSRIRRALAETGIAVTDPRSGRSHPRIDAEAALLSLEACDDGLDNDDDGLIDAEDPDCPPVQIDIRPRGPFNPISLGGPRLLQVAAYGAPSLDWEEVDAASLGFGPGSAAPRHDLGNPHVLARHLRDVDRDGFADLVSHYPADAAGISPDADEACLSGAIGREAFRACDVVIPLCLPQSAHTRVFPSKRSSPQRPAPCSGRK